MNFILTNLQNMRDARGLVVVIDVLRAFSTACYIFYNNAESIIPVETVEQAFNFKHRYPNYILIGERHGESIDGFDYNNSPTQIEKVDFTGKTVVLTTTSGTKGIIKALNADEIITGSFVNNAAIVKYIKLKKPNRVSFVCTDASFYDNEDYLYASYLKSCLENRSLNFNEIKKYLMQHPSTYRFLKKPMTKHSQRDFKLSLELNKFNFVVKVNKVKNNIHLNKL